MGELELSLALYGQLKTVSVSDLPVHPRARDRRGGGLPMTGVQENVGVPTTAKTPKTPATLNLTGQRWVRTMSRPLDVLAIIFLIDILLLWSFPDASPPVLAVLNIVVWLVWAGFALDYIVRLSTSTPKLAFIGSHKLDLLMVLVPMLRILRVFLVLRRSLAAVSTDKIAGSIVTIVASVVLVSAFLEWRVEASAPGATITTFREAIWWAVVTTTTVGYGDYSPVTTVGRIIAMVLMLVGIGLIGTVSATAATWFVRRDPKGKRAGTNDDDDAAIAAADNTGPSNDAPTARAHAELLARLDALSAQQEEIRALLARNS
jgi:voltage-gated potassium channel